MNSSKSVAERQVGRILLRAAGGYRSMDGTLFFVVGPSGIGKDTLLRGATEALAADARFVFARRTITRPSNVGDEGHQSVTQEEFERRNRNGGFLISWSAHGLHYGIPIELASELASGRNVVVNGSRAAVPDLVRRVKDVVIVEISAPHDVIAKRLLARGREDPKQVEARLARVTPPLPAGTSTIEISNDSDVETGIAKLVSALISHATAPTIAKIATRPEGESATPVATTRLAPPSPLKGRSTEGEHAVRAKEGGDELTEPQYRTVLGEFVEGKYSEEEIGRFLVAASRSLTTTEAVAIAKVRAEFARKIPWNEPIVVDKHSMGGIPGSRITLIVVPIVAAHGLAMPKTSSRAITSAAGTADAMETIARVDLDIDAVQRVVSVARGCIAWNGRLNHSALDDVMNAITRPLRLDSARWSVASILSKKLSAGVTNVIIDLPYGKYAKLKSQDEAVELSRLFGEVGRHLDLTVETCLSQGDEPIGRGVGPALEVRDVMEVLECSARAPQDLRKKALGFAARILRWAPDITSDAAANSRAESLLNSGAAKLAFERIIETQGRRTPRLALGSLAANMVASRSGVVGEINGWKIAGIARRAGAPRDHGAGLDLFVRRGDAVRAGDALYAIRSNRQTELTAAVGEATSDSGIEIS